MSNLKNEVIRAVRLGDSDTGRIVGQSLKKLRELAGLTQKELAARLDISRSSISNIENIGDVHIHSLQRYVAALGATLRIEATFPATEQLANQFNLAFDPDTPDENQLVFPIFGDDIFRRQRDVVLSIRPQYTSKIMEGKKTVELRRRFPISAPRGTVAYIYSTSPERAMVGRAEIADVVKLPIEQIWKKFGKSASIKRSDFYAYFDGLKEGFVLQFTNPQLFPRSLSLSELRDRFDFEPPQSFLYATPILRKALHDEFPNVSY
ncbi:helix-turn-helix domain-containing protein [Filomicrobium sp.]|uniref:helix-turn-helix domain-containing protein n=1 Tax=Filomicrobium sp. TaxID=2024831 RepID=UPI00258697B9|nr:helix-turn-helix domain-containing protein [Filomicrobium sp.]MCV0370799.1 helix-turn-helix domain-containing protein [Filomicrobium sp.]